MVIVSVAAFGTFSFAVRTNSTGTEHTIGSLSPPSCSALPSMTEYFHPCQGQYAFHKV